MHAWARTGSSGSTPEPVKYISGRDICHSTRCRHVVRSWVNLLNSPRESSAPSHASQDDMNDRWVPPIRHCSYDHLSHG